jgi:glycosyltransferase involved in cell wall biosynthesis
MHSEVSAVIPAYNAAKFIGRAIGSVLSQSFPPSEIIVVDDGSTDDTEAVVAAFGSRVRYFRTPNSGPAAARNLGIRVSSGKYIAFLDADDWWLPHKIETQIKILSRNDNISFVCADWFNGQTGTEAPTSVLSSYKAWEQTANFDLMLCENFALTSTVVLERDKLLKLGLFLETLRGAEDRHLWLRLLATGDAFVCKEILVFRRLHPGNTTATLAFFKSQVKMVQDVLSWPAVKSCPSRLATAKQRHNEFRVNLAYKYSTLGRYSEAAATYRQLYVEPFCRFQSGVRYVWYGLMAMLERIRQIRPGRARL